MMITLQKVLKHDLAQNASEATQQMGYFQQNHIWEYGEKQLCTTYIAKPAAMAVEGLPWWS
jgi:hypothetical protein